jgi:hypothetical protein
MGSTLFLPSTSLRMPIWMVSWPSPLLRMIESPLSGVAGVSSEGGVM